LVEFEEMDFISRALFVVGVVLVLLGGVKQVACSCYRELVAASVHSPTAIRYAELVLSIIIIADCHALS
jgi:hypothetical protein